MPGGVDREVINRIGPEPITDREREYMKDLDPTEIGIFAQDTSPIYTQTKTIAGVYTTSRHPATLARQADD